MSIGLSISFLFNEEDTDLSQCSMCKEMIVTKMHRLYLSVDSKLGESFELVETKFKFCRPCKLIYDESHTVNQPPGK